MQKGNSHIVPRGFLFICFLFFVSYFASSANQLEYTQNYTISEGLAHNGITAILQDSRDYLWFATYDGLNLYDGYQIKTYKNLKSKNLFASNRIRTIAEDSDGNLWLGTENGITVYNHDKESYRTIFSNAHLQKSINGPVVRKILIHPEQNIVVCGTEGEGLLLFNRDFSFIAQVMMQPNVENKKPLLFNDGIWLDKTTCLFTTSQGLCFFDLNTSVLTEALADYHFDSKSLIMIDKDRLLVTDRSGVAFCNVRKDDIGYHLEKEKPLLSNYHFVCLAKDKNKGLWLGTDREGIVFVKDMESFYNGETGQLSFFNVKSGFLRMSCFLPTENYGFWAGSYNYGVFRFDLNENPFHYYSCEYGYQFGIRTDEILKITKVDRDKIFLFTNNGGVSLFNTSTELFEPVPFEMPSNYKWAMGPIFIDSRNDIWLRYYNEIGVVKRSSCSRKIEHISEKGYPELSKGVPHDIVEDKQGNIWLACDDDVFKISIDNRGNVRQVESLNDHPYFKNKPINSVRTIYCDPHFNFIWIGTDYDGLIRIENQKDKQLLNSGVGHFLSDKSNNKTISSNFVSCIVRLPNNELWVGTEQGGINKVLNSDTEPEFISFTEEDGLSNDVVKSILYDEYNNLWISTNIGLNKFDTKDYSFRILRKQDGLPFDDYTYPSANLVNGYMVFSGLKGFCYFKPGDIPNTEKLPKLAFGDIAVFNKKIMPGDTLNDRVLYNKRIVDGEELVLSHKENSFSVELISLHFSTPENHFLKYKLLPLDSEWLSVPSGQRLVHYNNLQPGDYTLMVKASNSLNEWSKPKSLKIKIEPPFWLTIPAYSLYFLFVVIVGYSILYYVLRMNRLRHSLEIEHLEKENVKEVNAAKLRFFSNISHEIKTPLTLISGPIAILADRFKSNEDVREKLELVQRQSKKISRLVEQVHDFQTAENKGLRMDISTFCFNDFIQDVVADFKFLSETEKKKMILEGGSERIFVQADKDKLEKIIDNLLNNAFKYTRMGDTITFKYSVGDNRLHISISDTGIGIDQNDLPHIFERFYRIKQKGGDYISGSGIGLAFSKILVEMHYGNIVVDSLPGRGTTFSVALPVLTSEVPENEKEREEEILKSEIESRWDRDQAKHVDLSRIEISGDFNDSMVFLVEDNPELQAYIAEMLSRFFKVKTFGDGKSCLDALEKEWPDLIVSDVKMPFLSGLDLCKSVKSNIKTCHIPIVLLTACSTIDDQLNGLHVGADSYIKKPFELKYLVKKIESLLKGRKQLRERFQTDFPLSFRDITDDGKDTAMLEKLYQLMLVNLDNQDLDISSFAKDLYLNRTQFYQKVKALTGQTPFELLKNYRLKKAQEYLELQKYSVNDVCLMTGFKNRSHFSRLFKEKYNVSPGNYASQHGGATDQ